MEIQNREESLARYPSFRKNQVQTARRNSNRDNGFGYWHRHKQRDFQCCQCGSAKQTAVSQRRPSCDDMGTESTDSRRKFRGTADFIDWQNQNQVFDKIAAFTPNARNLTDGGSPERIGGAGV